MKLTRTPRERGHVTIISHVNPASLNNQSFSFKSAERPVSSENLSMTVALPDRNDEWHFESSFASILISLFLSSMIGLTCTITIIMLRKAWKFAQNGTLWNSQRSINGSVKLQSSDKDSVDFVNIATGSECALHIPSDPVAI